MGCCSLKSITKPLKSAVQHVGVAIKSTVTKVTKVVVGVTVDLAVKTVEVAGDIALHVLNVLPPSLEAKAKSIVEKVVNAHTGIARMAGGLVYLAVGALTGDESLKVEGAILFLVGAVSFLDAWNAIPAALRNITMAVLGFIAPPLVLVYALVGALVVIYAAKASGSIITSAPIEDRMRLLVFLDDLGLLDPEFSSMLRHYRETRTADPVLAAPAIDDQAIIDFREDWYTILVESSTVAEHAAKVQSLVMGERASSAPALAAFAAFFVARSSHAMGS